MSLFIALPMYGGFCMTPFFRSCLCLKEGLRDISHQFYTLTNESAVHRARNQCAKAFLSTDYERMMFIDSDIEFNAEDVGKLWAMDADIAVGVYSMKKMGAKKAAWINGSLVDDLSGYDGHVEVDYAGTGFMMIKRQVFDAMSDHVEVAETEEGDRLQFFHFPIRDRVELPEDYEFCRAARSLGFNIVMDPAIELKHYGLHGFG